MTTVLRRMEPADLDRVIEMEPVLFGSGAWSRAVYTEEASRPDRWYVVVESDGVVIGYAGIALGQESSIMTIGVDPAHRRQGHASTMLAELIDRARRAGAGSVFLEVRAHDDGAQRLYASFGFVPVGVRRGYYQPEGTDAVVMRLPLETSAHRLGPVGSEAIEE